MSEPESLEQFVRRRWNETGIKLWNPDFHAAGLSPLRIPGQNEGPDNAGSDEVPLPQVLEFRTIRAWWGNQPVDSIVCEGVIVDPPNKRE
jgi:hypothetical protein